MYSIYTYIQVFAFAFAFAFGQKRSDISKIHRYSTTQWQAIGDIHTYIYIYYDIMYIHPMQLSSLVSFRLLLLQLSFKFQVLAHYLQLCLVLLGVLSCFGFVKYFYASPPLPHAGSLKRHGGTVCIRYEIPYVCTAKQSVNEQAYIHD